MASHISDLANFEAVGLKYLDSVKLMNRVDQKFILTDKQLHHLLPELAKHYRILEINGKRIFSYDSLYFDTPALDFYRDHHNGKPNRVKVRRRAYLDTGTGYFEVKRKVKGYRTEKDRVKSAFAAPDNDLEQKLLQKHHLDTLTISPSMNVRYKRITLTGMHLNERITIDTQLEFEDAHHIERLEGLVIIEVKQEQIKRESQVIQLLRIQQNRPFGISKYALGIVLLNMSSKTNAFRHKVAKIKHLIASYGTH